MKTELTQKEKTKLKRDKKLAKKKAALEGGKMIQK